MGVGVGMKTNETKEAHRLAMSAKNEIFLAQDALGYPDDRDGKHMRKWLDYLRVELEAFDRACIHSTHLGAMDPAPKMRKRSF